MEESDSVKPIRFSILPEDSNNSIKSNKNGLSSSSSSSLCKREQVERKKEDSLHCDKDENENEKGDRDKKGWRIKRRKRSISGQQNKIIQKLEPNFSLHFYYPAVIFEKVCFSVNKSQQQSNFLNELLFRFKHCATCLSSSSSSANQKQENNNKVDILKSIDLTVPYGSIFGLLGPSSCGKTTLLRCLVGLLKPESGMIRLFGEATTESRETVTDDSGSVTDGKCQSYCCMHWKKHASNLIDKYNNNYSDNSHRHHHHQSSSKNKCKVPGSNVGYMPQDLGLYEDFTIEQLLTMFGQYVGMEADLIKTRITFMAEFLDLPQVDRQIQSLSGGQKRRVSFAIACLHMPPLIILDEPTVGVDPLLRKSIWKYLRRLADKERKTIIITTHYIEEAAQADQVALMRAGEILVQDTPARIMESNGCKTLEEAFLRICNNVSSPSSNKQMQQQQPNTLLNERQLKLYPQPRFDWHNKMSAFGEEEGDEQYKAQVLYGASPTSSNTTNSAIFQDQATIEAEGSSQVNHSLSSEEKRLLELRLRAQEKVNLLDSLQRKKLKQSLETNFTVSHNHDHHHHNQQQHQQQHHKATLNQSTINKFSLEPNIISNKQIFNNASHLNEIDKNINNHEMIDDLNLSTRSTWNDNNNRLSLPGSLINNVKPKTIRNQVRSIRATKFVLNKPSTTNLSSKYNNIGSCDDKTLTMQNGNLDLHRKNNSAIITSRAEFNNPSKTRERKSFISEMERCFTLTRALLYKNYRRNVNSLPLLAFQFLLPIIQMISFSLCVGGRPTNIGLGLVNHDQLPLISLSGGGASGSTTGIGSDGTNLLIDTLNINNNNNKNGTLSSSILKVDDSGLDDSPLIVALDENELLSHRYLSFIDNTMISVKPYNDLKTALEDVRRTKLWAAMEISENFTSSIISRFDLDNFYNLDLATIKQSVIKLYPDRSNKVLDMICLRSLTNSYRQFLSNQFEHFKRLPIEVKEPIFNIKANLISNSIDGYTESIAAGLLASLTYIMAAGLTTFIMVVERSAGILERTYTSGISPIAYLLAHAVFRSFVMMLQIAVVMFLTFYLLQQPMVGSMPLAYLMLMTLNLTGIAYGLLISSLVTDQNGAALTIVSSLVVKITMSGILWPFEAIPHWLRAICYIQPLTMPVQALKTITLKGNGLEDKSVQLGFVVSLSWLALFLTISAKRFKFYQH